MKIVFAVCLGFFFISEWITTAYAEEQEDLNEQAEQMTDLSDFFGRLVGDWSGRYNLWLEPGSDAHVSQSNARVSMEANGVYPTLTYDWVWKEKPQSGVFLFEGSPENVIATWGDSWHQQPATMRCEGAFNGDGKLVVLGSYGAGEGPDWGWRTEFSATEAGSLLMEVYNITPEGEEALAVRAEYGRVSP